ncbi:hypothetical protein B0H67DRAFT_474659 [Lasiosphaeris hirsuta]|uniref:Uncharacterized protein n=1 Tax=Lasiosphaeris hirsuta TaxID=260670 RepID=A0AA40BAH6_9PEZI|nr:hypothetical protein B0H67DRAFT_474659 [Lasiosphaeris hirsuta]
MESISLQSSPQKLVREAFVEKPESPILPPQEPGQNLFGPFKSQGLDGMAETQGSFPRPQGNRNQVRTPEPRGSKERINSQKEIADRSPSTPGHLAPFDWDDFEARYEEALSDANRQEQDLLEEFETLIKYFNVWAAAASVHDTERGVKRLQTRERYVKIAEQSLSQKKKHLTEVVRAFQSALALLSQS